MFAGAGPASGQSAWPGDAGTTIATEGGIGSLLAGYEPSGAAWHTVRASLFIVGDDGQLTELARDGTVLNDWVIGGDLEGVTIADPESDLIYVGREHPDAVLEFDISTGLTTSNSWNLTSWMTGSTNLGLEALTYVDGLFYAGHQGEGNIYIFDLQPASTAQFINSFAAPFGRWDLSGMHYEEQTETLYAIHDSANVLVEMEADGTFVAEYALPGSNQEGIAFEVDCPTSLSSVFISEDSGDVLRYDDYPSTCVSVPAVPALPPIGFTLLGVLFAAVAARETARPD